MEGDERREDRSPEVVGSDVWRGPEVKLEDCADRAELAKMELRLAWEMADGTLLAPDEA